MLEFLFNKVTDLQAFFEEHPRTTFSERLSFVERFYLQILKNVFEMHNCFLKVYFWQIFWTFLRVKVLNNLLRNEKLCNSPLKKRKWYKGSYISIRNARSSFVFEITGTSSSFPSLTRRSNLFSNKLLFKIKIHKNNAYSKG